MGTESLVAVAHSPSSSRRRPIAATTWIAVVVVGLTLLATRCVSHPIGPARTFPVYEGKAVTTAESALSEVATTQLTSDVAARGRAFGPYVSVVVSGAEDALDGLASTFGSIQPPDARAQRLGDQLLSIIGDATDHVRDVRIAARRGDLANLAAVAAPLVSDRARLESFAERHG